MFDLNTTYDELGFNFIDALEERELSMAREFPKLADHLRRQGAALIRLEYKGSEGEGGFLPLRSCGAEYREITVDLPTPLMAELHGFCETLLNERHPGWKNRHGACGDFGWDITRDTFVHVHRPYESDAIHHTGVWRTLV